MHLADNADIPSDPILEIGMVRSSNHVNSFRIEVFLQVIINFFIASVKPRISPEEQTFQPKTRDPQVGWGFES